jgi:TetR/AcrR family transcriptional regulator, transcriptional repressor for nem operon
MRRSKKEAARTRARIIERAAVLFRERGIEGIGLADLMHDAGLTHGGFYRHFASRNELVVEACSRAFTDSVRRMSGRVAADPERGGFETIVKAFLCEAHVADAGHGCAIAALGGEIHRCSAPARDAFTRGVVAIIDHLAQYQPGRTEAKRRERASASFAAMLGALIIARGVGEVGLRRSVLQATRQALVGDARG